MYADLDRGEEAYEAVNLRATFEEDYINSAESSRTEAMKPNERLPRATRIPCKLRLHNDNSYAKMGQIFEDKAATTRVRVLTLECVPLWRTKSRATSIILIVAWLSNAPCSQSSAGRENTDHRN